MRRTPHEPDEPVQRITTVAEPLADDVARRGRRYLWQMSIRVVCFVGAVAIDHWIRWVLLVGAVVLPYVAVLLANAGRERGSDPGTYLAPPSLPAAGPREGLGPAPEPSDPPQPSDPTRGEP